MQGTFSSSDRRALVHTKCVQIDRIRTPLETTRRKLFIGEIYTFYIIKKTRWKFQSLNIMHNKIPKYLHIYKSYQL